MSQSSGHLRSCSSCHLFQTQSSCLASASFSYLTLFYLSIFSWTDASSPSGDDFDAHIFSACHLFLNLYYFVEFSTILPN